MTKYSFGDIVFIEFYQFASGDKKKRPAMVILDIGDNDVVVCPVTTRKWSGAGDYFLEDWKKSGLKKESWARLAKVSCLEKSDIVRVFGKVTNDDREQLLVVLRKLLELQLYPFRGDEANSIPRASPIESETSKTNLFRHFRRESQCQTCAGSYINKGGNMFQKFIPILCILLPSCFFSDQVYIKKIWTFSMVDGYKNCMYDIKNNNFIIKSFHFGSDLTDVYFDLLYKKYNIKNDDCSRPYHSPSKSYVESYNRCVCRHIKKTFGEDIFKKAYQEAKVKYKKILQKENRNLQDTQKKAAVVSNVKFDFKPTSENRKNLYFVLLHYPSGAVSEVKEGEFIDPGFYYYNPLLKGYQPKQEMLKVRVCCGKKKVFLGGILIKISVENQWPDSSLSPVCFLFILV